MTRGQLLDIGLFPETVERWIRSSRLHPLHRGVYLLGHRSAPTGATEMAALLACGYGSVISHASAAALWRLINRPPAEVEVTVVGARRARRSGIRVHRTSELRPGYDVRTRDGIPLTSPARTLLDLAPRVSIGELERMVAEAQVLRLVRRGDLVEQLERHPRRPGTRALRALLERDGGPAAKRNKAERRLLGLVRSARLPAPRVNSKLGPYEPDLLWPKARLVVEFDGWRAHSSRRAFERDRARDAEFQARGYRVLRVTWRQLTREPEAVIARIARALAIGALDAAVD